MAALDDKRAFQSAPGESSGVRPGPNRASCRPGRPSRLDRSPSDRAGNRLSLAQPPAPPDLPPENDDGNKNADRRDGSLNELGSREAPPSVKAWPNHPDRVMNGAYECAEPGNCIDMVPRWPQLEEVLLPIPLFYYRSGGHAKRNPASPRPNRPRRRLPTGRGPAPLVSPHLLRAPAAITRPRRPGQPLTQ
jgi:hypothetical protein